MTFKEKLINETALRIYMVDYWEFKDRALRYYGFNRIETMHLIISIVSMVFIWMYTLYAYRDITDVWSTSSFVGKLLAVTLMVSVSIIVQLVTQKLVAIYYGYKIEYRVWYFGLLLGIIVSLVSGGHLPIIMPGGITMMHLAKLRIGEFRYGLNTFEASLSALWGPLANIILAMLVKFFMWQVLGFEFAWVNQFFLFSLVYAFYTMLPIAPLAGVIAFYGSKLAYVFATGAMMGYILLIIILGQYSFFGAVIIGAITWLMFYKYVK